MGSPEAGSVVERYRAALASAEVSPIEWPVNISIAPADLGALLAVVEAAQALDDNWEAVNRCYTLGHPYAQELRRKLAALHTPDSAGEREAE